jgi:hypothetical protein
MRRTFVRACVILPVLTAAVAAAKVDMLGLYQARAIVTGTREESRKAGFESALEDVLAKVSGDARLAGDPRVAEIAKNAESLVEGFTYRDRMAGLPLHDDQGTYDRPHDLTVTFDKAKIDATLGMLGLKPWTAPRPTIVLVVAVTNGEQSFVLSADGDNGTSMRMSIENAALHTNMPLVVPEEAALDAAELDVEALLTPDMDALQRLAQAAGGDVALAGTLDFSEAAAGWLVAWRMAEGGTLYEWGRAGVNFDEGFRSGVRGAMQILSGHGAPK